MSVTTLTPLAIIERDVRRAAATLGRDEARFLVELAWATGLVEGEGYFCPRPRALVVSSTDKDVLLKMQEILGGHVNGPYKKKTSKPSKKPMWRYGLAQWEQLELVVTAMIPMLSARRQIQARAMLANPKKIGKSTWQPMCPRGHRRWRYRRDADGNVIGRHCIT